MQEESRKNSRRWGQTSILSLLVILGLSPIGAEEEEPWWADHSTGSTWSDDFELFGSVRLRPEIRSNYDFDKTTDDQADFVGQRIQFGFEKRFDDVFAIRVTAQDSRVWGGSPGSDSGFSTANQATGESLDLREGYLEWNAIGGTGFRTRAGRQMLQFGDGRLVGATNWSNVGRSFDAWRIGFDTAWYSGDLFGSVLAEEDSDSSDNGSDVGSSNSSEFRISCDDTGTSCTITAQTAEELDDAYFTGFHNEFRISEHAWLDAYYLGVHKKYIQATVPTITIPGGTVTTEDRSRQRDDLHTFGARLTNRTEEDGTAPTMIDWSAEGAWQRGRTGRELDATWDTLNQRVTLADGAGVPQTNADGSADTVAIYKEKETYDAYAYALTLGLTVSFVRVGGEYVVASGDPDRSDGAHATFSNLFPTNHKQMGIADQVSWQNMVGRSGNITLDFETFGKIRVAYWDVNKHKRQDAWYDVSGTAHTGLTTESASNQRYANDTNSDGTTSTASARLGKHLFREWDITYAVRFNENVSLHMGYAYVLAEDSARIEKDDFYEDYRTRDRSFDPRADFAYIMIGYEF